MSSEGSLKKKKTAVFEDKRFRLKLFGFKSEVGGGYKISAIKSLFGLL